MAPEMLKEKPNYGLTVDIWALGITAIELATGVLPYSHLSQYEVLKSIEENDPPQLEGKLII
jgi:serine/threonine protein kinase